MSEGLDYSQRFWEDVRDGEQLPTVVDDITYRRVIMNAAAAWDYFPGHHDPEYARSQGQPTIYLNTVHLMGFVDPGRHGWAGGRAFVVRRRVSLRRSVYANDRMVGEGVVTARGASRTAAWCATVAGWPTTARRSCAARRASKSSVRGG